MPLPYPPKSRNILEAEMGITLDRGYWYFVKRVPKRYAHVDARQKVT